MSKLKAITAAVAELDDQTVLSLVEKTLGAGTSSADVVQAVEAGMRRVGERYEREEIFLAGLIMAGEIFRSVMELAQPGWQEQPVENASGKVLLGTVAADIHDIGKNMAELAFRMFGFTVRDLGVNVPPETFLEETKAFQPQVVGMSGLLTTAFDSMRDTVALLREELVGTTYAPLIIIGGGTLDEQMAHYVGADLWTTNAMEGVRQCRSALDSGT